MKAVPVAISARIAAIRLPAPGALYHQPRPVPWRLFGPEGESREGAAGRAVVLFEGLEPATDYRLEAEGFESLPIRTTSCAGLIDASDFGLLSGTALDDMEAAARNAQAMKAAVDATPTGGTLRLGPGRWTAFPVALKSGITFHLAHEAELRAPSRRNGWTILPARNASDAMLGSWEGLPDACFAAPVHAIGAERLVIEGPGTINGSGDAGDWWTWPKGTRDGARRPRGLHLIRCSDVTLLGFTIRNAPSWTIHPQGCMGLVAAGLTVEAPHDSPNTDGFNPEGCTNVRVEGLRFSVGDDCIAIKAGKRGPNGEADHLLETRGVSVRHCLMERGHGGVVIGSEMSGGVHDVTVEDCEMIGTDRGLRLKTRRGRGGSVTGIAMRRVRMDGVLTAISANAYYHCDADGHEAWVQSREAAPRTTGTPEIDGIAVEDVDLHHLAHAAGVFLGVPEQPIRNISICRLRIHSMDPDASMVPPVMADGIRPMRHEFIVHEHADVVCDDHSLLSPSPVSVPSFRAAS